jgi:DNA-directed RNA polymerase sigma subunit (sigma70/sigma32)
VNHPDQELEEMKETCSLDVADRGGTTLQGVGDLMNLTRERARQVEFVAATKVKRRSPSLRAVMEELQAIRGTEGNRFGEDD